MASHLWYYYHPCQWLSYHFPMAAITGMMIAMANQMLARIDERLKAVGLKAHEAEKAAGLSGEVIRNLRRGLSSGMRTETLAKLAPVLQTTPGWLMTGQHDDDGVSTGLDAERLFEIASLTVDNWLAKTGLTVSLEARNRMIIAESQRLIDLGDAVSKDETADEDAE